MPGMSSNYVRKGNWEERNYGYASTQMMEFVPDKPHHALWQRIALHKVDGYPLQFSVTYHAKQHVYVRVQFQLPATTPGEFIPHGNAERELLFQAVKDCLKDEDRNELQRILSNPDS